jgi:hypothetical protein
MSSEVRTFKTDFSGGGGVGGGNDKRLVASYRGMAARIILRMYCAHRNNTEAAAGRHAALGCRHCRPPSPPSPLPRSRHIRRRSAMVHTGWLGRQAGRQAAGLST